jgi:hypothetical protein
MFDGQSFDAAVSGRGDYWIFGAVRKECSEVRHGGHDAEFFRNPAMSLDFFVINIHSARIGSITYVEDGREFDVPFDYSPEVR